MKRAYLLAMAAAVAAPAFCAEPPAPAKDLGVWMAVGDSISHGTFSHSYRWFLQKILIDNGVGFDAQGYLNRSYSGAYDKDSYCGREFDNEHCAQFNIWTDEVAGLRFRRLTSMSGLQSSNLDNWLGLSDVLTPDSSGKRGTYHGPTFAPDTFTYMLGTNDLQGMRETSTENIRQATRKNMESMLAAAARKDTPTTIYLMSVTATDHNPALARRIAEHNTWLRNELAPALQGRQARVVYADVNPGLQDVSREPGQAVAGMFAKDRLHPTNQGSMLVAGNLARAMGCPGRTVALPRRAAADFNSAAHAAGFRSMPHDSQNLQLSGTALDFGSDGESATWMHWKTPVSREKGFTAEFSLSLGDGAANGWEKDTPMTIIVGDGSHMGSLVVTEPYIKWGDSVIYSRNMAETCTIRIAYRPADTARSIRAGFYVWLGGTLIGEALPETDCTLCNGVMVNYPAAGKARLESAALDSTAAWAPAAQ